MNTSGIIGGVGAFLVGSLLACGSAPKSDSSPTDAVETAPTQTATAAAASTATTTRSATLPGAADTGGGLVAAPPDPAQAQVIAYAKAMQVSWSAVAPTETVAGEKASVAPIAYYVAMASGATPPSDCKGGKFTTALSYQWSNLNPASAYSFRVCAVEVNGLSIVLSEMSKGVTASGTTATLPVTMFLAEDTTTQGSWTGVYGSQGNDLEAQPAALPAFSTVKFANNATYTWTATTADTRALQITGDNTNRIAAVWYAGGSFTMDLNLTDGNTHNVTLYFLDWDNSRRAQQVQISSYATGDVLDTQAISAFSNGIYLSWKISGHVLVKFIQTGGANAVLNAVFLDPASS